MVAHHLASYVVEAPARQRIVGDVADTLRREVPRVNLEDLVPDVRCDPGKDVVAEDVVELAPPFVHITRLAWRNSRLAMPKASAISRAHVIAVRARSQPTIVAWGLSRASGRRLAPVPQPSSRTRAAAGAAGVMPNNEAMDSRRPTCAAGTAVPT